MTSRQQRAAKEITSTLATVMIIQHFYIQILDDHDGCDKQSKCCVWPSLCAWIFLIFVCAANTVDVLGLMCFVTAACWGVMDLLGIGRSPAGRRPRQNIFFEPCKKFYFERTMHFWYMSGGWDPGGGVARGERINFLT